MKQKGFTLVELTVVIVVIAILVAISTFGLRQYQEDSRDARRAASITTISESLEKYYDKNGEYPSCSDITAPASEVTSSVLVGIDQSALVVPGSDESVTNSIKCNQELTSAPGTDFIEYVGDGSAECNGDGACLSYKLRYISESEDSVKELASRRSGTIAANDEVKLTAGSVTHTAGTINWQGISNVQSYVIQRSSNASFTSPASYTVNNSTITRLFTDMAPAITEYFRFKAVTAAGDSAWSNTVTLTPTALDAPVLTSTQDNPQQLTQEWDNIVGAAGYRTQRSSSSAFTTGVESSNQTELSKVYTDTPIGSVRYYRVQATVANSTGATFGGPWSNVISYTSFVPQPDSVPSIAAALSGSNAVGTSGTVTCTQGATPYYQLRETHKANSGNADSWTSWSTWSSSTRTRTEAALQGHEHKFQANAACVYAGSYSTARTSTTAAVVYGFTQPATPTWPSGLSTSWKAGRPGNYMNYGTFCPAGTWVADSWFRSYAWNGATPRDYYHTFGFNDYWYLGPTGGANVEYWARYYCGSSYATSGWSPELYTVIWVYP